MSTETLPTNVTVFAGVKPDKVLDCPSLELLEKAARSKHRTVSVTLIAAYDIAVLDRETTDDSEATDDVVDLRITPVVKGHTLYIDGALRLLPADDGFTVIFDGISEDSITYRITYSEATGAATYVVLD